MKWHSHKNSCGQCRVDGALAEVRDWCSLCIVLPSSKPLVILYVFQSVERRKRTKLHTFIVRTGPRNCTYVSPLIALPQDTPAKKAGNCMYSIWPCVQVKSRGSIKRKRKWILGCYQQYMPFKLIQKLYVQSHQEKRKGKFGLCFLLETYDKTTVMLNINRSMKH